MERKRLFAARVHWRQLVLQLLLLAGLVAGGVYLAWNIQTNLQAKGIATGFDFLVQPAGFGIGESGLPYVASDAYWLAFVTGLANTVRVMLAGLLTSTLLGLVIGLGRLSRNGLLRLLCGAYVETFRNIPLLLQLLAWYALLTSHLPEIADPWRWGSLFLCKSGLFLPWPVWQEGTLLLELPRQYPFSISGGACLTPEFLALWLGLSLYSGAYLAEILRAGIAAVPTGQVEAAQALALRPRQVLWRVILPQALRVIVPPATNQYSSLIKSSALAITVGYPDLVSVASTVLNQSGRVVECITLILLSYLLLSLLTSVLMGRVNRHVQRWVKG